jgi:signal transduction histidine kinase
MEKESEVYFAISDTGCGIPAEIQAKIFEPFVTAGKPNGTGLGMAIVKSVIDAHKVGSAWRAGGKGTKVQIRPCRWRRVRQNISVRF